jgi:hypothetical protein
MDAANHAATRHRAVSLFYLEAVSKLGSEVGGPEPLEESASVIRVDLRRE